MSVIINEPFKCTFVHIPKCAGNSVSDWMRKNFNTKTTKRNQHATIGETLAGKHSLGPFTIEDLGFTFCIVRNPWDYAVSWYTFKIRLCENYIKALEENPSLGNNRKEKYNKKIQENKLKRLQDLGFKNWARQTGVERQHNWAKDCDYIMRLENLTEDFQVIQKYLNCFEPLGHRNPTGRRTKYQDYYQDQETIDIVAKKFKIDIETYGYSFD